ncbi:MAG TPA: protein kinase [Solirubrobacterales bacterium]|nr:protein kinase [Solirubrobacterales bacterium]
MPPFTIDELEPVKFLQRGAMGFVWRYRQFSRAAGAARHTRTPLGYVAVKCVEVSEYTRSTIQHAYSEARAQRQGAGNGNVVALHDVLVVADDLIALVMEEVEGGRTLADEIDAARRRRGKLSAETIARWGEEISNGLQSFHSPSARGNALAHRDIAPQNVLLTREGRVKLGDMGIATVVGDTALGPTDPAPVMGRVIRMAPEQYYGDGEWGTAVDYWALGLIVFELATSTPLEHFCAERVPKMTPSPEYSRAIGDAVRRQARQHPTMHPELRDLVTELVVNDPAKRAGAGRLREARTRIASGRIQDFGDCTTVPTATPERQEEPSRWLAEGEIDQLRESLRSSPETGSSGAFERLVGRRRAERHQAHEEEP